MYIIRIWAQVQFYVELLVYTNIKLQNFQEFWFLQHRSVAKPCISFFVFLRFLKAEETDIDKKIQEEKTNSNDEMIHCCQLYIISVTRPTFKTCTL